jgi:hypothetical protein
VLGVRVRNRPTGGEAAVGFLHRVDGVAEVFEGVVGAEQADLSVAERQGLVEVSCDVGIVEIGGWRCSSGSSGHSGARIKRNTPLSCEVDPVFWTTGRPCLDGRRGRSQRAIWKASQGVRLPRP